MKSCIDIRSGARNAEGALIVILGIAKKRDAVREEEEERESWWCWLEHEREHARSLRHQPRQSSTGAAHMRINTLERASVESGVDDNIALARNLSQRSLKLIFITLETSLHSCNALPPSHYHSTRETTAWRERCYWKSITRVACHPLYSTIATSHSHLCNASTRYARPS